MRTDRAADPAGRLEEGRRGLDPRAQAGEAGAEEALEAAQQRFHALINLGENIIDVPPLSHRYVAGHIAFEFHVRVKARSGNGDPEYFVAQLWRPGERRQADILPTKLTVSENQFRDHVVRGVMGRDLNRPVFVAIRQGFQHNERMRQTHRGCDGIVVERLEVFQLGGIGGVEEFPRPFGAIGLKGELDRIPILWFDSIAMTYRQLPGEVIEGPAQIVDRIPDNQTPAIINLYEAVNVEDNRALVAVELAAEAVVYGVRPELFLDGVMNRVDVCFRSFELRARSA
jgi:hypothetical protein